VAHIGLHPMQRVQAKAGFLKRNGVSFINA
jgi:hypothetical protein